MATAKEIHAAGAAAFLKNMRCPTPGCGLKPEEHAATESDLKAHPSPCKLTAREVELWWLGRDGIFIG